MAEIVTAFTPRGTFRHITNYSFFILNFCLLGYFLLQFEAYSAIMFYIELNIPNGWWYMPPEPVPADPGWDDDPAWSARIR